MSCPIGKDALEKLKQFIDVCRANPDILHLPDLQFFKNYIESFGGQVPAPTKMSANADTKPASEPEVPSEPEPESDPESELEFDTTGCVDPDEPDPNQTMGDSSREVSEEDIDKADEKRIEAMGQFSEGNFDQALKLYTEAIEFNPNSALLFAKRGQTYLKQNKPNACIKDCTRALELNCDSATAYKFRGRAYRLLGEWEKAAQDLRQACNIDFDEQTDEWLREVNPNAKKIEQHKLKIERKQAEKEEKEKMERIRKAREAHSKAQERANEEAPQDSADFMKLLQDPEVMAAFQDPEVAAAFQDLMIHPENFTKYQSNPKIMDTIKKLTSKFSSGMNFPGGFPGFPGAGMFGAGAAGANPPRPPTDDDNLD